MQHLEKNRRRQLVLQKNNLQKAILLLRSNDDDDFSFFCASINATLNSLLRSVGSTAENNTRYDWMALSRASIWSEHVANTAVQTLIYGILSDLASEKSSSSAAAEALGHLTRNGDEHIIASWRKYGTNECGARDIVLAALPLKMEDNTEQIAKDEETEANQRAQVSLRAISSLIPCFEILCEDKQFCGDLAEIVLNNLPSNSEWNYCRIKVVLPILAAVVCSNNKKNQMSIFRGNKALSLRLCAFALEKTRTATTRSLAVSCLFAMIASPIASDLPTLSQILFQDSISPAILKEFQISCQSEEQPSLSYFQNAVCLAAIVGAASGCRGGDSGFVADNAVSFLLNLCCRGIVDPPFATARIHSNEEVSKKELSIIGGMAFGNMLTIQGGHSPFWKQRAASLALTDLLDTIHASHPRTTRHGESSFLLGCLIALSHFVCCIAPLPALGDDVKMEAIVDAILTGLSICTVLPTNSSPLETNGVTSFLTVGLSALLKLLSDKSMTFWTHISLEVKYTILSVLLKTIVPPQQEQWNSASGQYFCSSVVELLIDEHVPRQLVAIECLLQVLVQFPSFAKDVKTRSAILSKLAVALDSPSYAIRKASGRARNLWSLTDG